MEIADFFLLLAFMFNCLSTLIETQNVKFIILLKVIPKYGRNECFFDLFVIFKVTLCSSL